MPFTWRWSSLLTIGVKALELNIGVATVACDGQGISLNSDDLIHNWNGSLGSESGLITPLYGDSALTVNWQSVCVQPPAGSFEDAIQHLTVRVERIGDAVIDGKVGFTASFEQLQRPEILRLYNSPWNLSDGVSFGEHWDSAEMADQPSEQHPDESIERHWDHLLQLKTRYQQLALQIQDEEHQIREMLQQGCPSTLSNWKNCRSFGCRFRISLTKFPDLIRQIRYRFGPFPSALPASHCSQCPQQDGCDGASKSKSPPTPTNQPSKPQKAPHATATSTVPTSAASNAIPTETEYFYSAQNIFTICVIVVLASTVLVFGLKLCRSTTYCRRRRADRAARREERHARWAYGFAAHRLRWRQWWEGYSHPHAPVPAQTPLELTSPPDYSNNNNMPAIEQPPGPPPFSDTESDLSSEPGVMQAEIRGLRQALEYVGQLVRGPDRERRSSSQIDSHSNSDHEIAELLGRTRRQGRPTTAHTAASSTAGLSTVLSTGTSSLLTLDTPSSVTVDTLEVSETTGPPPSYHA
ncbi:uncharacterized protein LDX57_002446 [Aspergillus melleus]|uniref:uncharacterized protein n=1 Tax=Aspergillus melleus TaxID=138277 RepID=UPI001E8D56D0|nr:uncharacterized protein LDX57_002446 [Aspergillus melleus]KAH8424702.1 hypothetical protein LDX57_002446 [Aspergillus melleus]